MRKLTLKNKKGFTLVEMLVSIAIFIIIGSLVSIFIFQGFSLYRSELQSNEDESNVRSTITHIINIMRRTTSDNISVVSNTLNVNGNSYSFDGSHLLLNGNVWVSDISAFSVTSDTQVVNISITSQNGRTISTSYGLR